MISILIVDPSPKYPQYDYQVWEFFPWPGTSIPIGKRLGEWAWVGRIK